MVHTFVASAILLLIILHYVSITLVVCTDSRSNQRSLLFSAVLSPEVIGPSVLTIPTHNLPTRWVDLLIHVHVSIDAMLGTGSLHVHVYNMASLPFAVALDLAQKCS